MLLAWKEWMLIPVAIWKVVKMLFTIILPSQSHVTSLDSSCSNRVGHPNVLWPPLLVWRISGSWREVKTSSFYPCRNPFFDTHDSYGPAASSFKLPGAKNALRSGASSCVIRCSHCLMFSHGQPNIPPLEFQLTGTPSAVGGIQNTASVLCMKAFQIPEESHSLCPLVFLFLDKHPHSFSCTLNNLVSNPGQPRLRSSE